MACDAAAALSGTVSEPGTQKQCWLYVDISKRPVVLSVVKGQ